MLTLEGIYESFSSFESNTGYSYFYIKTATESILSKSILAGFAPGMRIKAEGDYQNTERGNVFVVTDLKRLIKDSDEAVDILAANIKGISANIAENIVDRLGFDITDWSHDEQLYAKLTSIQGIGDSKAVLIEQFIRNFVFCNSTYEELLRLGMTYPQAVKIVKECGASNMTTIMARVYRFVQTYDVPLEVADRIALSHGFDIWDNERIDCISNYVIDANEAIGSTRMPLTAFIQACVAKSNEIEGAGIPDILFDVRARVNPKISIYTEDDRNYYVARKETDLAEVLIAQRIGALSRYKTPLIQEDQFDSWLQDTEIELKIRYNEMQKKALKLLTEGGVSIITGGPGTGKTTLIKGMISVFLKDNRYRKSDILLCATTGKAASRLEESTGMKATTVHTALGITPSEDVCTRSDRIEQKITIIDEMSMCDTILAAEIVKRLVPGNMLIMVGDKDQLPSVGPGTVFGTLCESEFFPVVKLTETVRQKKGSTIIENSLRILDGNNLVPGHDFDITIMDESVMEPFLQTVMKENTRVLCPVKEGTCGTKALNDMIQVRRVTGQPYIRIKKKTFYEGDKIIMTRNRYDRDYCNGEIGTIIRIKDGFLTLDISGRILTLEASECDDMELSYAVTVHKYQGSEDEDVCIVLPHKAMTLASRKLLYTAVTRAKDHVHIVAEQPVLDACISNNREAVRNCGLKSRMQRQDRIQKK